MNVVAALAAILVSSFADVAAARACSPSTPARSPAQNRIEWGKAPDGERGIGAGRSVRDIARLLRSNAEADQGFVAALYKLEPDLRVLLALTLDRYREQGYLRLLEPSAEPSIASLERVFRARMRTAEFELQKQTPSAEVLARMLVDARLRARPAVVAELELELRELTSGLALLFAHLDGFANLVDREADLAAQRVDLAAARLRAMRLDLEALREQTQPGNVDNAPSADALELLAIARDKQRRQKELRAFFVRLEQREQQVGATLFSTRRAALFEPYLHDREELLAKADKVLEQVRVLLPDTPQGEKAPAEVQALGKSRRMSIAAAQAVGGLSYDPLNAELNYFAAVATEFIWGGLQARPYFDRYLALRGIRAHDGRTYAQRRLTREEQRALDALQVDPTKPH